VKRPGSDGRRRAGARPMKGARSTVPSMPAGAELGRATRGLVGPGRSSGSGSRGSRGTRTRPRLGAPNLLRWLFTPARAAGLLGMLAAGFLLTFVTGPSAFALSRTDLPALQWTDPQLVTDALALDPGGNVFRLDTAPLASALLALPAVVAADVEVGLPDAAAVVHIEERAPVLAWQVGETRYVIDRDGVVFALVGRTDILPAGVAVIEDRRTDIAGRLVLGGHLDAVDLDVATRLGSVTPADIGSNAGRLRIVVTDADGFVVAAGNAWTAVFGFYSPSTRAPAMIPGQVRLLRSFLAQGEASVLRIVLASETDGTYVPRATPKASTR
jgi:hypothetical protein